MPNGSSGVFRKSRLFDFAFTLRCLHQRTHSSSGAAKVKIKVKIKRYIHVRTPLPQGAERLLMRKGSGLLLHKSSKSFCGIDNV
jgi:hypothetical protein